MTATTRTRTCPTEEFGQVLLVRDTRSRDTPGVAVPLALKRIGRARLATEQRWHSPLAEKAALTRLHQHPMVASLITTVSHADWIGLVLEFVPGGELWTLIHDPSEPAVRELHVSQGVGLRADAARFYVASLVCILEALNPLGIVHRDIKPENVLLCAEINWCVGCTRQFFSKSFLGDDAAVVARSSGKESASPRHRAGIASMAWRTTRRFSTNAP